MTSLGDLPARILAYLEADAGTAAAFGKIYAEADAPPVNAGLASGPYLCTKIRGGIPEYTSTIWRVDLQVTIYASKITSAWTAYRALHAALVEPSGGAAGAYQYVIWGAAQGLPQSLESAAGWPMLLAYFTVYVRSE